MRDVSDTHIFSLGPFRFASEIDIAELHGAPATGERTVSIRLGGVPHAIEGGVLIDDGCAVSPTEFLLDIPGTARYYVRNGDEVRIEIAPGAPAHDVSTYLLGSVFGVLCHQNGLLPLHASAVEHDGAVTAFLGDSGAGKSTLAACLARRGHRIVSDDICLLDPADDAMRVIPVAGWLKLWDQSLQHLGETPDERHRIHSKHGKFRVYLGDSSLPVSGQHDSGIERPRLARVLFLTRATDPAAQPTLEPVATLQAIATLMDMAYVGYVPALGGQQSRLFQHCAQALRHARAMRLTVPWDLDRMDSVLDLVEREIRSATP